MLRLGVSLLILVALCDAYVMPRSPGPAKGRAAASRCAATAGGLPFDVDGLRESFEDFLGGLLPGGPGRAGGPAGATGSASSIAARIGGARTEEDLRSVLAECLAPDVVFEDLYFAEAIEGRDQVADHMVRLLKELPADAAKVVDDVTDGRAAAGWTWHLQQGAEAGLRGITFLELDGNGKVSFLREAAEPLFKPGSSTAKFLKAVAKPSGAARPMPAAGAATSADAKTGSGVVRYLWLRAQYEDAPGEASVLRYVADDVLYEDFNFPDEAFCRGRADVEAFVREFDIPGITFRADRICDGDAACCFTWDVVIEGIDAAPVRGVSFYKFDTSAATPRITFLRDVPESAIKPPPLRAAAKALRPGLQSFATRSA